MISVLFARADSIYKSLGVDVWDINRDARTWPGGNAIVAHPPCRAWGKLKAFARPREGEKELAIYSINMIRQNGGVLEHPRHSGLWKHMELPTGKDRDAYGGFTICIDQFWFGHKAAKNSLLYICGCNRNELPLIPMRFEAVQHVVSCAKKNATGKRPNNKKEITKSEREATPADLAKWLIEVAQKCNTQLNPSLVWEG